MFRREAGLDLIRVQDVGLAGADDPTILDWAATDRRVLLTYDTATMPRHVYDRVARGRLMSGVVVIREFAPMGQALEDVLILATCSEEGEREGQGRYLPL